jgi:adenylosuccinate lyase
MHPHDMFRNISPLDHRYWASNKELFDRLSGYLSEDASVHYCAQAEVALVKAHLEARKGATPELFAALDAAAAAIDPSEVYAEEEITKHNVRALVNVLQRLVPPELAPLVHMGATSVDIIDTAQAARLRDVSLKVGGRYTPGRPHPRPARGAHNLRLCDGRICLPPGQMPA